VRDLALLQRLTQNLPPMQGVMVTTVAKSGAAAQAGLMAGDVITAVAGQPTPDSRAFRTRLEAALAERSKYIELTLARRNLTVETALPPHYLLRGRRAALVLPPGEPEYAELMRRELVAAGAQVTSYATGAGGTGRPLADLTLDATDLVLFAGGLGARQLWDRAELRTLVGQAAAAGKTLAAVGPSTLLLVSGEEPLKGRKITTSKDDSGEALRRGGHYTGSEVEVDGRVITTTGFDRATVRRFLKELVRVERDRQG
jgi:putative intracellular protease/amidase